MSSHFCATVKPLRGWVSFFMASKNVEKVTVVCGCGKSFEASKHQVSKGKKKYCSKGCMYKYKKRPSGLKYSIVSENSSWFKKEQTPWNSGTTGLMPNKFKGTKGLLKKNKTSFSLGQNEGVVNVNWKGSEVGYFNLHNWVYRHLGKATKCVLCGSCETVNWANKSHEYKRDLSDWIELCKKCHGKHDSGENWGSIKKYFENYKRKK